MSRRDRPYQQMKSLDVLFGDAQTVAEMVPLETIYLPQQQPRRYFDPQAMQELVESVRQHGILQPLLVRKGKDNLYELVAGERRYRAAKQVQLTEVPVVIRELSDEEAMQLSLIENLCREDLNPVEETEGILQLLALRLGSEPEAVTPLLYRMKNAADKPEDSRHNVMPNPESQLVEEVFTNLGLMTWESFVKNRLPLLNLPEDVLGALRSGEIAYTKAKAIARLKDEKQRKELLDASVAENLSLSQIQSRLKAYIQQPEPTERKERVEAIVRRVKQAKIWEDPQKWERLEALLAEMEALIGDK
ncbi:ParB/RepB/Spo0J family partition protein [Planktothrix sp. FACHB-1355]|uniref:ParB/RepB/Spo0J family partition protein n=1 Tax=Aerosakkonema funiforme FACHB-1375 TaxID=2949571 RepID=A0A926VM35_9CYAN|nr:MULTISPECIES: ParB/RepB/Spo0J family partition protein [Oscillatoriales]MBD2184964.1 ParB/RepB/Spo0J family partition protein [Aerosakkonema funiforme FACHB-1375]MBD3559001.1 ParB/RepB/Spo0J family partition protein [Planktothrix sp. FACHB-1355]